MKRVVIVGGRTITYTLLATNRVTAVIKVLPGEVRACVPRTMPLSAVDDMIIQNADRIFEVLKRLGERPAPVDSGTVFFHGRRCTLVRKRAAAVSLKTLPDRLEIALPDPDDTEAVRTALRGELVKYALKEIDAALKKYAPRMNAVYGRVTIREQKTRWGSCSSKNNLNFNWKLVMAPPECLEYVVVHELCHLTVFNHSDRFWALVGHYMPDYEPWKKWLADHGDELNL